MEIHRQVGLGPIAGDAQALELLALDIDPAGGELAALAAELHHRNLVLVAAAGAVLLLDLPLDRQAVTVPAGDVAGVSPHHLARAHHHVLEDLVERVADVEVAVGVGRPVVEGEGLAAPRIPGGPLAQAVVDPDPLPAGEPVGLAPGQARAHGKAGRGEVQRVAVVGRRVGRRVGAHRKAPGTRARPARGRTCEDPAPWDQEAGPLIRPIGAARVMAGPIRGAGRGVQRPRGQPSVSAASPSSVSIMVSPPSMEASSIMKRPPSPKSVSTWPNSLSLRSPDWSVS